MARLGPHVRKYGPSLKTIGRRKVCFHLDQLVFFRKEDDGTYAYVCHLVESSARVFGSGVMCAEMGVGFQTQIEAEEKALEHIVQHHQAMGGQKNPRGRRKEYRERKIAEQTLRRKAELRAVQDESEYFD